MKTRSLIIWVAACAMVVLSTQAYAIDREFYRLDSGNLKFGKWTLIPGISVQEAYDDNIYLGSGFDVPTYPGEEIKSDWLTYVKPGVGLSYDITGGRGKIALGYQGTLTYYSSDSDNNWQNHQGELMVDYKAPSGWIFKLADDYVRKEDPYGDANQFAQGALGLDKAKRWQNTLKGALGYQFGETMKTLVHYNYQIQEYDKQATRPSDYTQDYTAYEGGLEFAGKVMPKTWLFARGFYGEWKYDTTSSQAAADGVTDSTVADYSRSRLNVGLNWDGGGKWGGELNVGWAAYNFKNNFDSQNKAFKDEDTWIAFTSVDFSPSELLTFALNLNRELRPTGSQSSDFFVDTGIGADVTYTFPNKKFEVFGGATYSYNDYNQNDREDRNVELELSADYFILKWLSAGVGYIFMQKDSSSNSAADLQGKLNEFTDNRFLFRVTAAY